MYHFLEGDVLLIAGSTCFDADAIPKITAGRIHLLPVVRWIVVRPSEYTLKRVTGVAPLFFF